MTSLKKLFVAGVMLSMVFSLSLAVAPAKAAATAGDLIKIDGMSAVYFLGGDGNRYVFPNAPTYFSWYSDFTGVKTIPQSELEGYPLKANVTIRPGTKLVKVTTIPTVYAVEPGGKLRSIVSEANATALFGANWNKKVVDVPDGFFVNYIQSSALTEGVYPVGSLVKADGSPDVFYFDGTNFRKFDSESAFNANRFRFDNVQTAPSTMTITAGGTAIAGAESVLTDTSSGAGGTPNAGTGLSVALAGNTAPSGTLISGQAIGALASFNLTASPDGDVKVTGFAVKRTGISTDSTLSSVYLYDGVNRLTDSASVSSGVITFVNTSGILTVPKGTTKTITVRANVAATQSGKTVGATLNAATDVTTDGATVSGSFPMSGNIMSIADADDLATVAFGDTTLPSSDGTPTVQNDYVMWQNTVTVNQRIVNMNSITFRNVGSIQKSDIGNFKLYVGGIQKGSAVASMDDNGYVTFDLSSAPVSMDTGSREIKLVGDIKSGSTRKITFQVRQAADISVVDSSYGVNILATATSFPVAAFEQTIASGNVTISRATDSPSGNVLQGASGVTLATYTVKASGENVKIETLRAAIDASYALLGALRNGKILANGVQIGSTASLKDLNTSPGYTEYTVNYTLPAGTEVALSIVADIYDDNGANNATTTNTFTAELVSGDLNNAQGVSSFNTIDFPSVAQGNQLGNQLTITTGSMALSKTSTYGDQTVVVPQTSAYKIGSFVLTGNSSEDVNLNNIMVDFVASGTSYTYTKFSDVYVVYGSNTATAKTSVNGTNNNWAINQSLVKNGNLTVDVYGKLSSGTMGAQDWIEAKMTVTGTTANSGQTVNTDATHGQHLAVGDAGISVAADASSPVSAMLVGGTTQDIAAFKFNAVNDAQTLTEITLTFGDASTLGTVALYDGTTAITGGSKPGNTSITYSGLNIPITANTSKVITVKATLGAVGTGAGNTGANVKATLATYKHRPASTGTEATKTPATAGSDLYVFKGTPTMTTNNLSTAVLSTGSQKEIASFTLAANTNSVYWNQFLFSVATTSVAATNFKVYDGGSEITGTVTVGNATVKFVPDVEQSVSGGGTKTYSLKADLVAGSTSDISVTIGRPTGHASPTTFTAVVAASPSATFVWSDGSAVSHDTTTSADYNNDFLVKGLPSNSWVMSK
jgi:hypothetical protein